MNQPLVIILMGSKADLDFAKKISASAQSFGLTTILRIGSAHKTSQHVTAMLQEYEQDPNPKVYITVAGRSNALSGFTDGMVSSPVIACPPPGDAYGGADIYSSLRMPSGISPAVVIDPQNAALLAAKIIGLSSPSVRQAVRRFQVEQADKITSDDGELNQPNQS
jgi:5-(carboxyamino)imidazole ribonucleotide mutase